jgi:quinol monooxygenase YgiN
MSVTEIARLKAADGKADEMETSLPAALAVIAEESECHGTRCFRSIERPDEYVMTIVWSSVRAHMDFRKAESFDRYLEAVGDCLGEVMEFAHYEDIGTS